jgi:hypothetical protein
MLVEENTRLTESFLSFPIKTGRRQPLLSRRHRTPRDCCWWSRNPALCALPTFAFISLSKLCLCCILAHFLFRPPNEALGTGRLNAQSSASQSFRPQTALLVLWVARLASRPDDFHATYALRSVACWGAARLDVASKKRRSIAPWSTKCRWSWMRAEA